MTNDQSELLTQTSLVAALRAAGCANISERTVGEWRRKQLIPEFDMKSRACGQGLGKEPGSWMNRELVLAQALWVHRLLRVYRRVDSVYLPLWLLGYSVPLNMVKKALERPFEEINRSIQDRMERERGLERDLGLEDLLDEVVYAASQASPQGRSSRHQASQAMLRICYNLFFNNQYDLDDAPFRRMVEAFRIRQARRAGRLHGSDSEPLPNLFEYAPFIKEHLSFDAMDKAARYCTDEDLRIVECDLGIIREALSHLNRIFNALFSAAPPEYIQGFADYWPAVFAAGRLCVLVDLSLRRSGRGDWIDAHLSRLLDWLRLELNEAREAEFRAASAEFVASTMARTARSAQQWSEEAAVEAEAAHGQVRVKARARRRQRKDRPAVQGRRA